MKLKFAGTLVAAVLMVGFIPALSGCSSTSYVQTVQDCIIYTLYDSDDSLVDKDDYYDEDGNVIMSSEGLYYVVTGYSGNVGDATIVSEIDDIPVKSIASQAFINCKKIKSLVIEEGVESAGGASFAYCTSLKEVSIPSTLEIGYSMFAECSSLESVTIAEGVEVITNRAFYGCSSLTEVNLPSSLTQIGAWAFRDCSSLAGDLVIPEGVTVIEQMAFAACASIESVEFLGDVTEIDYAAFSGCSSFVTVELPETVESIGDGAFSYCTSLESINIPCETTFIGTSAFEGCEALTSVTFEPFSDGSLKACYLYEEELDEDEGETAGSTAAEDKLFDYNYYGDDSASHIGYIPSTALADPEEAASLLIGDCYEAYWYLVAVQSS